MVGWDALSWMRCTTVGRDILNGMGCSWWDRMHMLGWDALGQTRCTMVGRDALNGMECSW